jgi:hypothetical protein
MLDDKLNKFRKAVSAKDVLSAEERLKEICSIIASEKANLLQLQRKENREDLFAFLEFAVEIALESKMSYDEFMDLCSDFYLKG